MAPEAVTCVYTAGPADFWGGMLGGLGFVAAILVCVVTLRIIWGQDDDSDQGR